MTGRIEGGDDGRIGGRDFERGSASLWVLAGGLLVIAVALIVIVRTSAVAARHRAETAADLSALAAAAGIGVDATTDQFCARAGRVAVANGGRLAECRASVDASGRSGTVTVRVALTVRLAGLGNRIVTASARAGRLAA